MVKNSCKKIISFGLALVLIAAMALMLSSCGTAENNETSSAAQVVSKEVKTVGTGSTQFDFSCTAKNGEKTEFKVNTDKKTVGDALLDAGLIAGENGDYGLYVKTVNGETLDFEKDGYYWAFYVNDDFASSGVDQTEIKQGEAYAFVASK